MLFCLKQKEYKQPSGSCCNILHFLGHKGAKMGSIMLPTKAGQWFPPGEERAHTVWCPSPQEIPLLEGSGGECCEKAFQLEQSF
jgi:hypothetical protein